LNKIRNLKVGARPVRSPRFRHLCTGG